MFSFIRRLQQKPERQRRSIALWTAVVVTVVVFVVWVISFFTRLDAVTAPSARETLPDVSPLESVSGMLSSVYASFTERL